MNRVLLEKLRIYNRGGKSELTTFSNEEPASYWKATADIPSFPALTEDTECDIAVIGGGITGLTTAYELTKRGFRVAVIEADRILNGTTAGTTAKITAQHDFIYADLIQQIGLTSARLYFEAHLRAMEDMKQIIKDLSIDCGLIEQDAYLYTNTESGVKKSAVSRKLIPSSVLNTNL